MEQKNHASSHLPEVAKYTTTEEKHLKKKEEAQTHVDEKKHDGERGNRIDIDPEGVWLSRKRGKKASLLKKKRGRTSLTRCRRNHIAARSEGKVADKEK